MTHLEIFKEYYNGFRFSAGRFKNVPRNSQRSTVTDRYYDVTIAQLSEKMVEMTLGEFQILLTAEQAHELACHLALAGFDPEKFLSARSPASKDKWQQAYEASDSTVLQFYSSTEITSPTATLCLSMGEWCALPLNQINLP